MRKQPVKTEKPRKPRTDVRRDRSRQLVDDQLREVTGGWNGGGGMWGGGGGI